MKVQVVYCYPAVAGDTYVGYAWRYLSTYAQCPAGIDHENIVVCNGGNTDHVADLFRALPNCRLMDHDNSGYDIGAFQAAAAGSVADMIVFMGVSSWIRGAGWLKRMADAFTAHGEAIYGCMGNSGWIDRGIWPHVRTTGFWLSPALFNRYPIRVTRPEQRYEFEHGRTCLTQWVRDQGLQAWVAHWGGEADWSTWDTIPNGFHRGDQSALLIGDRLTDPPYYDHTTPREIPKTGGNRV